jgi:hypothetical protein
MGRYQKIIPANLDYKLVTIGLGQNQQLAGNQARQGKIFFSNVSIIS